MSNRQPLPAGFGVIWTTVVLDLVGFGIVIPILPLYAEEFGASPGLIGLLLATYSLAQLVGASVLGRVSDRRGRKPVLLVSLFGSAVGSFLTGLAGVLPLLFVARALDGFSGGSVSVAHAAVADIAEPEERPRLFGLLGAAIAIGFVLGPAIGSLAAALGGVRAPFLLAGAVTLLNAIAAIFRLPETSGPSQRRAPLSALLRRLARGDALGRLLLVGFAGSVAFGGFEATFSLLGVRRVGLTVGSVGLVFAGVGLVLAVVQGWAVKRVVDRVGDRATVRIALGLNGAGMLLLVPDGGWASLVPALLLLTVGQGLLGPALSTMVTGRAGEHERGAVLGLSQSSAALARVIGPVLALALFDMVAIGAPYLVAAAVVACASMLVPASVTSSAAGPDPRPTPTSA